MGRGLREAVRIRFTAFRAGGRRGITGVSGGWRFFESASRYGVTPGTLLHVARKGGITSAYAPDGRGVSVCRDKDRRAALRGRPGICNGISGPANSGLAGGDSDDATSRSSRREGYWGGRGCVRKTWAGEAGMSVHSGPRGRLRAIQGRAADVGDQCAPAAPGLISGRWGARGAMGGGGERGGFSRGRRREEKKAAAGGFPPNGRCSGKG